MQNPQGGGGMGMQDMQRLQQQLQAQYQRQQQANGGGPGGANALGMHQNNPMQAQQFPGQFNSGGMNHQQNRGGMNNTALGMMQNQQQPNQQQPNVAGNNMNMQGGSGGMASVFGSLGNMNQGMLQQGQNPSSTMDASTGSSARLMAMAGMNQMGAGGNANRSGGAMDSSSAMQNMQVIMQQQAQQVQKNQLQNQMGFGGMQGGGGGQQQVGGQPQGQNPQQMFNQSGVQNNLMMRSMDGNNQMSSQQQMMLQQQLANLQQQMQGQPNNNMGGVQNPNNRQGNQMLQGQQNSSSNLLQQRQQQLLQQMQSQQRAGGMINQNMGGINQGGGGGQDMNGMMQMMQQQQNPGLGGGMGNMGGGGGMGNNQPGGNLQQQQQQQNAALQGTFARGPLTEQQLRIRQQNIMRASSEAQSMNADGSQGGGMQSSGGVVVGGGGGMDHSNRSSNNNNNAGNNNNNSGTASPFMGGMDGSGGDARQGGVLQRGSMHPIASAQIPDMNGGVGGNNNNSNPMNDASTHSHHSARGNMVPQQQNNLSGSARGSVTAQQQKSFLDGNFAGGWQSNADLPDRRKVIFSILEVIKQMRPNTNTTSTKLPHMAKSLEEHLYRSAQTKEEYLDPKTLKQRLQTIAQGLDNHRAPGAPPLNMGGGVGQGGGGFNQMDTSRNSNQGQGQLDGSNWGGGGGINNPGQQPQQQQQNNMMQQQQQNMLLGNMQQHPGSNIVDPWDGSQNGDQGDSSLMNSMQQPLQGQDMGRQQSAGWASSGSVDMSNNNPMQGNDDPISVGGDRAGSWSSQMGGEMGGGPNDQSQIMSGGGQGMPHMGPGGSIVNPEYPNTPKYQDTDAAQKRKVILQQQQRLLLLRHASKCKNGPTCSTKFCSQMVTLWRHMKTCRDKNCKTSHCLSSRCVLNHYRICKSQGKTATCEVCGPVMAKIKQNGREEGSVGGDPLAHSQQQQQQPDQQQGGQQNNLQQQPDMASLAARMMSNQRNQSAGMQNQAGNQGMMGNDQGDPMNDMSQMSMPGNQMSMMGAGMNQMGGIQGGMQGTGGMNNDQMEQNQLQQLQQHQMKMQQQLESLKELQRQQQQLLDQQGRLQEQAQLIQDMNSPQAQQLRQQQMLLDQLQKRCQQQQLRLQQEIEMQSSSGGMSQVLQQQMQTGNVSQQMQAMQNNVSNPDASQQQQPSNIAAQPPNGMPLGPPSASLSRSNSVPEMDNTMDNSTGIPEMDDSASNKKKRRGNPAEKVSRRNSGKAKQQRAGAGGKGKALRQQLQETKAAEGGSQTANLKLENFAKKKALVQSNPKERAQKKRGAKIELAPLAGETSSLISYMSRDMIMRHLESLNKHIRLSNRSVTHKCLPVVQALIDDQFGWVFHDPVDPVALGLPDYFDVVKTPMHMALVKKKLENAIYPDIENFARDVKLVFENAILYNGDTSEVGELAQTMLNKFDELNRELIQGVESSQNSLESSGQACSLCGNQTRRYEPAILHCRGKCGMQRIKRGATYYTERTKSNHWCQSCFETLRQDENLVLDDGTEIKKGDLFEFKNDALPEEPWVNCDECQSWVHHVCALYNGRTNRTNAKYTCPNCILKRGDVVGFPVAGQKFLKGAEDLECCKMSDAIEEGIQKTLEKAYSDRAKELGVDVEDVERAEGLTVRVLSSVEKKHQVGEEMYRRYQSSGCPTDYPVRSKCISLFQNIHGVDTMLFAMYVYEYDQDCPAPNRRRVYISYLDSVQYFEPKCYRTSVYHSVLLEYLRYVKARGFHTAHIWSCPPTPGDDYIFFIHPSHQLFPREDMLRAWYHKVLDKAKSEGIVIRTSTLYDEYFNKETIPPEFKHRDDPLCLPYFEGDYIPGEIENIIKQFSGKGITDSKGAQDKVMDRLKHNLEKMKDNFIVVHLRNRRFAAAVERGEDVSNWSEDSDEALVRSKRAKINGKEARPTWSGGPSLNPLAEGKSGGSTKTGKRSLDEIEPAISSHMSKLDRLSSIVGDTRDEDPSVESDLFESRQQFLNYCQTNHCQFDELRRVKHSTLMVLFQLHNPTAPKFLQQCSACYRDITHGYRYHCDNCKNYDLCGDCYEPVTTGMWAQKDDRYNHDKSHTFTPIDLEGSDEASKSGEERQQALKAHIELLEHAGTCSGSPGCQLQNCEKMKRLFDHVKMCDVKPKTGCKICTRLLSLCVLHARLCPVKGECPIPFCDRIRERNQRVRRQQQLMDERRRQAQNELYHAGVDV